MENKTLIIKDFIGDEVEVKVSVNSYEANNQIAILLYNNDGEYYSDLSVFIQPLAKRNHMAVDINNCPHAEEFIKRYEIGKGIGFLKSGMVLYPVYEMNVEKLKALSFERNVDKINENNEDSPTIWDRLK